MLRFVALEYFANSPMLAFPVLALALFLLVFLSVTVRTLRTRRASYDPVSRLPLDDGKPESKEVCREHV